ncbi:MAG: sporulation protein YunB [Eubacteriales bacterium]|nr:sporulation protein YunB [Eubacteriales bacterium]
MRRPHKYRYWRRGARVTGLPLFLIMLLAAVLVFLAVFFRTLRPGLAEYAENLIQYKATIAMEQAVSEAISENGAAISSLATLSDGSAAALMTDSVAAECVRSAAVENTYEELNKLEEERLAVPLGTLLDPQYFAGAGPELPFGVVGLGMVSASIQSDFTDSGVNQTKYGMTLLVRAEVNLHALWCSRSVVIENTYPLTEMILVGEVPAVYCEP